MKNGQLEMPAMVEHGMADDVQLAKVALTGDFPLALACMDIPGPALGQEGQEWTAPVLQHPQK